MQNLLERSRRIANQNQSPIKLSNISPEKYGGGAYCDLTYTPSKLADNVLYKEVTTLKKIEEGNGRLRQTQALNSLFQDRLHQIKEERDGIQKSLTSQIIMYKRLLQQCQIKSQTRIKQVQNSFKLQIKRIIAQKQEQAKYAQSQKQLLQNRIEELQRILDALKEKYENQGKQFDDLRNQKQKLDIVYRDSCNNLAKLTSQKDIQGEQAKNRIEELKRQIFTENANFKKQLDDTISTKNKQIQNLQRLHRTQIEKLQNKRAAQNLMKNQQLKDITNAFEAQGRRLNDIINNKQKLIQNLTKENNKQKQRILELTRSYENQINNLNHQKSRLLQQCDDLNRQNTALNHRILDNQNLFEKQKISLESCIRSLKDQLELNHVNLIRQKDKNCFIAGDLEKQAANLRSENLSLRALGSQNQVLSRQVRNLRQLLLQSSHEMEKCKEQFIRMAKQRDILILKLRQLGYENQTLHRIKFERQEQARGWKDSYYNSRPRY